MRIGRVNSRTPAGPFKLPAGPKDMICRAEKQLLAAHQPKWFPLDRDLVPVDVLYFRKTERSVLNGPWTMGLVDSCIRGSDLVIREVHVKYYNNSEDFAQFTDCSIHTLTCLPV